MIDREEDIAKELTIIEQRLKKSRTIGEMSFNQSIGYDPEFVELMNETGDVRYLHFEKSKAIRDETFVSAEHLDTLHQQITNLRSWLLQNGNYGICHPDYSEWINEGFRTEEEMTQYYWHQSELLYIACDEQKPQSFDDHILWLYSDFQFHNLKSLDVNFGFNNNFDLCLEFGDEPHLAYDVKGKLEHMTLQEFRIITFFLNHAQQMQLK